MLGSGIQPHLLVINGIGVCPTALRYRSNQFQSILYITSYITHLFSLSLHSLIGSSFIQVGLYFSYECIQDWGSKNGKFFHSIFWTNMLSKICVRNFIQIRTLDHKLQPFATALEKMPCSQLRKYFIIDNKKYPEYLYLDHVFVTNEC